MWRCNHCYFNKKNPHTDFMHFWVNKDFMDSLMFKAEDVAYSNEKSTSNKVIQCTDCKCFARRSNFKFYFHISIHWFRKHQEKLLSKFIEICLINKVHWMHKPLFTNQNMKQVYQLIYSIIISSLTNALVQW